MSSPSVKYARIRRSCIASWRPWASARCTSRWRVEGVAAAREVEAHVQAVAGRDIGHLRRLARRLLPGHAVLVGEMRRRCRPRARRGACGSSSKLRHVTRDLVAMLERGERGLEAALADVAPGAGDVGPDLDVHGLPPTFVVLATTSRVARAPLAGARAGAIVALCERSAIFPPARSPCCSATSKARRRSRAGSATRGPWLSLTTGLSCGARLTTTVVSSWAPRATVSSPPFRVPATRSRRPSTASSR